MPNLIQNISAQLISGEQGLVKHSLITGDMQKGNYIHVNGFTAFLQDYSDSVTLEVIGKPLTFGLKNNTTPTTLKISY